MRVSDRGSTLAALSGLRARLAAFHQASVVLGTGRTFHRPSEAPDAAVAELRFGRVVADVDRFRRSILAGRTRLETEDRMLAAGRDLLERAQGLAHAAGGEPGDAARTEAAAAVDVLHRELVALGNTRAGEEYVLAGAQTARPPFLPSGIYQGDAIVRRVTIDEGLVVETNHTGDGAWSEAIGALAALADRIATGTADEVRGAAVALGAARDRLLADQAVVGARLRVLSSAESLLAERARQALTQRDALVSVDPAQAAVELTASQAALEQAYAAVSRLFSASLVDYLR